MSPIDTYLANVKKHLIGMDSGVKNDILEELRAHVSDVASESEVGVGEVISKMTSPKEVGKTYRDLYGYGFAFKALFVTIAVLICVPSLPIFLPSFEAIEGPIWFSVLFFAVATVYLIWVSVVAGKRVGLYSGIAACVTRFVVLGLMLALYSEAAMGGLVGILSFVFSSLFLVGIGYIPGEAKKRWERKKSPVI
jgi:hypothetical protein